MSKAKETSIQITVLEAVALLQLLEASEDQAVLRALVVVKSQLLAKLRQTTFE